MGADTVWGDTEPATGHVALSPQTLRHIGLVMAGPATFASTNALSSEKGTFTKEAVSRGGGMSWTAMLDAAGCTFSDGDDAIVGWTGPRRVDGVDGRNSKERAALSDGIGGGTDGRRDREGVTVHVASISHNSVWSRAVGWKPRAPYSPLTGACCKCLGRDIGGWDRGRELLKAE